MTNYALDAKLAFHLALSTATLGRKVIAEDFDRALADGYAEIDRLVDAEPLTNQRICAVMRGIGGPRCTRNSGHAGAHLAGADVGGAWFTETVTNVTAGLGNLHNPLADGACPTGGVNCDRDHDMVGESVVHHARP
jgi:hypothetical protein